MFKVQHTHAQTGLGDQQEYVSVCLRACLTLADREQEVGVSGVELELIDGVAVAHVVLEHRGVNMMVDL